MRLNDLCDRVQTFQPADVGRRRNRSFRERLAIEGAHELKSFGTAIQQENGCIVTRCQVGGGNTCTAPQGAARKRIEGDQVAAILVAHITGTHGTDTRRGASQTVRNHNSFAPWGESGGKESHVDIRSRSQRRCQEIDVP